jgi:hypothetical protein
MNTSSAVEARFDDGPPVRPAGPTGTSPSVDAHLMHLMTRRRARARELAPLDHAALFRCLERAYARRLSPKVLKLGTGELLHLILELELPVPTW